MKFCEKCTVTDRCNDCETHTAEVPEQPRHIPPTSVTKAQIFSFHTFWEKKDLYGISTQAHIVMMGMLPNFQNPDHYIRISYHDLFFFGQLLYLHKYKT